MFILLHTCARSECFIRFNLCQTDNQEIIFYNIFSFFNASDIKNFSFLLGMFSSVDRIFCWYPLLPVSYNYYNKLLQTRWHKIAVFHSFGDQKSKINITSSQGVSRASREESSPCLFLMAFLDLWPPHSSLCLCGHIGSSSLCVSNFPLPLS